MSLKPNIRSQKRTIGELREAKKRKPTRHCKKCCGLSHRVIGISCEGCGLKWKEEVICRPEN